MTKSLQPVIGYFVLSFAIAWAVWILAGVYAPDAFALVIVGAWAPTISALVVTGLSSGWAGISELLRQLLKWRAHYGYYAFSVLSMIGVVGVASVLHAILGGSPPDPGAIAARLGFPTGQPMLLILLSPLIFIVTIFAGGPIAEELGWRGYAQPQLQARIGAGLAGLVIGMIWSLWHLPLFWWFPSAVAEFDLPFYVPLVTGFGVLFAWLYNRTGGSVLLCILLHAGINFALGGYGIHLVTSWQGQLIVVLLTGGLALILYPSISKLTTVYSKVSVE